MAGAGQAGFFEIPRRYRKRRYNLFVMTELIVSKSSRHQKIAGDFYEHLVLYWLSKYGYECARIDHVGIDLMACPPRSKKRWGISVKGRTRKTGQKDNIVNIGLIDKAQDACRIFGLTLYFAIGIDQKDSIKVFLISGEELLSLNKKTRFFYFNCGSYNGPPLLTFDYKMGLSTDGFHPALNPR